MLNRFEEERKKASKNFEAKKQKIREQEKKIYTNKPALNKTNILDKKKYSKDFLKRQKELNDNAIKKKEKLIEEKNKKAEEEYKTIISKNISNKNKKKYCRNKSNDNWVDRLYNQDTEIRKKKKLYLEKSFIPTFQPMIMGNKKKEEREEKNKTEINEVLSEYNENNNPELLINYLNNNKNNVGKNNTIFRNRIFGKSLKKYGGKKYNNTVE